MIHSKCRARDVFKAVKHYATDKLVLTGFLRTCQMQCFILLEKTYITVILH